VTPLIDYHCNNIIRIISAQPLRHLAHWFNSMQIMRRRLLSTVADNTKSFALSGCGWLIPFHLGVLDTMKEAGYLTDKSIIAGTSGGSLAAASTYSMYLKQFLLLQ
jgi:predicted acylesterase/phospholipase RssA